MTSLKQGTILVKYVRKSIELAFEGKALKSLKGFGRKQGVFVTLLNYPSHQLRGCIGFPYPSMELGKAVPEAARAAAFSDARFLPLEKRELDKIVIEISVLTQPKEIKCKREELSKNVKIGKDGLIVNLNGFSGLLLPQVAAEWGWDSSEFIKQACMKAGLSCDVWKDKDCRIFKFQAQIFAEEKPKGRVIEKH